MKRTKRITPVVSEIEEEQGAVKESEKEPDVLRQFKARKGWRDLSPVQKIANIGMAAIELVLTSLALWDIAHRPATEINGKKRTWVMASFIQPLGPVIYFLFGRKKGTTHMEGHLIAA